MSLQMEKKVITPPTLQLSSEFDILNLVTSVACEFCIMAAFQVSPDGHVIPPLNITQPTPSMSLAGFRWGNVSNDIEVESSHVKITESKHSETEQAVLIDETQSFLATGDSAPSHKTAPPSTSAAPITGQLSEQLKDGHESNVGPDFPLEHFKGAYAGNGFNTIFRPRQFKNLKPKSTDPPESFADFGGKQTVGTNGVADNILQLSLTLEQLTFGAPIGQIPNRGFENQKDIILHGIPYLQTIQDVTNPSSGLGNNPNQVPIHFEPGVWLNVPPADFQDGKPSIVRMASIPHGTTINAQGFSPPRVGARTPIGGTPGPPNFDLPENQVDARPFPIGFPEKIETVQKAFPNLNVDSKGTFRIPQDLDKFASTGKIDSALLRNPNRYLAKAIENMNITETITFEVDTGPGPDAKLNGGGTANIAFLAGPQDTITTAAPSGPKINAHAVSMKAKYWIERVIYTVPVGPLGPNQLMTIPVLAQMPKAKDGKESSAPTPKFLIRAPPKGVPKPTTIEIPGIQIQSSQFVILNFGGLSWPHVSVSSLVPTEPIRWEMK